jgi:hypothetical protein
MDGTDEDGAETERLMVAEKGIGLVAECDIDADGRGRVFRDRCRSFQPASLHLAGALETGGVKIAYGLGGLGRSCTDSSSIESSLCDTRSKDPWTGVLSTSSLDCRDKLTE